MSDKNESDAALPLNMSDFLTLIQNEDAIASLLFASPSDKKKKNSKTSITSQQQQKQQQQILLQTCQHLFRSVEQLSRTLQQVDNKNNNNNNSQNEMSLSGLEELYVPPTHNNNDNDEAALDTETIWGQVDLQNEALHALLKKSMRKLMKAAATTGAAATTTKEHEMIRLLDVDSDIINDSNDPQNNDDNEDEDEVVDINDNNNGDAAANHEEEDEESRRMRERMERALADQSEEEDDNNDDDDDDDDDSEDGNDDDDSEEDTRFFGGNNNKTKEHSKQQQSSKTDEFEGLVDPAAEELNNGFFDINEMEAFADEEEDMLPENVWEPTRPTPTKKKNEKDQKSFHQRQREGIDDDRNNDDGDDSDDDSEALELQLQNAKRKAYREDDEVEALYGMYSSGMRDDDDDDDDFDENTVNMTAADLFGKPDQKYFHKWKAQVPSNNQDSSNQPSKSAKISKDDNDGSDDDDSWDRYNFDNERADWGDDDEAKGKKTKGTKNDPDSGHSDASDDNDDRSDNDEKDEEDEPAKPVNRASHHARQSDKLQEETERLEQEMIAEKPWQMVGEASATARPVNSLLDGAPEFQVASKMAPVITEEHTADLEDIIKRRILAEDWDEVIPRELPDVAWNKKRGELPEVSQEKAKLGLGELYEREYLKKATGHDVDAAEKQTEEDKAKSEMKQLFANICSKLDALSNYHFAPRPVADEAEVRPATTPAIAMEEVLPLHVSDARGAAPEEVYGKKRGRDGILRSENELEQVSMSLGWFGFIGRHFVSIISTKLTSYLIFLMLKDRTQAYSFFEKVGPSQITARKGCRREAYCPRPTRSGPQQSVREAQGTRRGFHGASRRQNYRWQKGRQFWLWFQRQVFPKITGRSITNNQRW